MRFSPSIERTALRELRWSKSASLSSMLGILVATGALAAENSEVLNAPKAAIPVTIVTPTFPEDATAPEGGAVVQVTGRVLSDGTFQPQTVSAPEGMQPFADAVSSVLKWWRFTPAIDNTACAAKAEVFSLSLSFEGTATLPHIYVAMPKPRPTEPSPKLSSLYESISTPEMRYPPRLMHGNIEGQVTALISFGVDGAARSVNILSSTPFGAFDSEVQWISRRTTVRWKKPPPDAPVCVSRTYTFCIDESGRTPAPFFGCKR